MVLRNKDIRAVIEAEKESNDGILASFIDGQHFKNHPFFQKYKLAIRIQLYYDELEIVNPLGSKTDEKIEGSSFLLLNAQDLNDMKIKKGPAKKILKFLEECSQTSSGVAKRVEQLLDTEEKIEIVGQPGEIILPANIDSENWTTIAEIPSTSSNIASVTTATSNEEISIPKKSFSRFTTVRKTLLHHPQGANVLAAAKDIFTESHRRSLIRIVTSELVKTHEVNYYTPEEAKVALAESIVTEFPKLGDPETTKEYELYYDPFSKRGFIEYRLWTIRKNISPAKKKFTAKKRKMGQPSSSADSSDDENDDLFSEDLYQEKISWMKFKVPSKTNKSAISECMNITMKNRRKWILENLPTTDEIFDQFPRLVDYFGQMIDEEFDRLYSGASDKFLTKFSTYYVPRILTYCNTVRQDLYRVSNFIEEDIVQFSYFSFF
ncbi:uncharacterized protein LOC120357407 [Solenopsis invicta]|uniref:uncharacterized protein LOC120357407 n=1 Tax=Solenopsis invicta TaxID=13686 RepID=UPI00193D6BB7|nr:uncharacterized protein LOC120357407 [Solenopsis invicta]